MLAVKGEQLPSRTSKERSGINFTEVCLRSRSGNQYRTEICFCSSPGMAVSAAGLFGNQFIIDSRTQYLLYKSNYGSTR